MASITARKNRDGTASYRVRFRVDGRSVEDAFKDYGAAEEYVRLIDIVGGKQARVVLAKRRENDTTPTLRKWFERYIDESSGLLTGITKGTREGYKRAANLSFLNVLGDYPLDAIDKPAVGKWVAWQESQPSSVRDGAVSAKTVRNYHTLLSSTLAAAVEAKHISENPAYRTRLTKGQKREAVFLSPAEFNTLLHFIPEKHKRVVLFLVGTGTRWGEATAVTWGDLTTTVDPVTVRISKAWKRSANGAPTLGVPKTARGRRTISLFPSLVKALGKPGAADELMFANESGGHLWHGIFTQRVWKRALAAAQDAEKCRDAGLPVLTQKPTIHDLRHTHASWLIAAGTPLPYVQARLGHESITTTVNVYGHLVPDAHAQMAFAVADTMSDVTFVSPQLTLRSSEVDDIEPEYW